ncbi:ABC transporter permease [Nocardioides mangrovicus]|uniref:ABC transporter permease n=1 Tax=Nocardioides mangrovicus TaxID=2478913 RepID=A0A3L8P5E8_9ACTN|nr:ABC transporter permease [Nocardioides mangrovicus]RLV49993.1 ABC transporter permease [Nocardioides mangrovicus]
MSATQTDPTTADPTPAAGPRLKRPTRSSDLLVTALAVVVALVIGGVLIALADQRTRSAAGYFFQWPFDTFTYGAEAAWHGYVALFQGAIFNPRTAANGTLVGYLGPLSETLTNATPLILGGLSVGLAFRAGLFNIGGQGQIVLGAIFGGYVGFAWDLPPVLHLLVAVLAAALGGALWGGLVGWLKARTGAHEVITTIMLNYVATALLAYLLSVKWFQAPPFGQAISRPVDKSAQLPPLLGSTMRVHAGLILALLAAWAVWWLLERSVLGFRLKAVGANQFASRTAGMDVGRSIIVVMVVAGALAGLAGACQAVGTNTQITQDIDAGIGFDAITVALLGRAKPGGIVWAGLLFGALHAGGVQLQSVTGTPIDLVQVIQSLIVLFIAAPAVVRAIFRIKASGAGVGQALAKGWNG